MKLVKLTQGKFAKVDDDTYELVKHLRWQYDKDGYASRSIRLSYTKWAREYLHYRVLTPTPGLFADHKNRDRLDNRRENLRLCSRAENMRNSNRKVGKYGYRGIGKEGNKYYARISTDGKSTYSYGHTTPEEAARAYDRMAREQHGEFAFLNFP